jgi:hypothetical protein
VDTLGRLDSIDGDASAPTQPASTLARRVALGGIAATLGAAFATAMAGRASAQESDTTVAETTTRPPLRPTDDDTDLLAFANSLELAAYELYRTAVGTGALSDDVAHIAETFGDHHRQYGAAIAGVLGSDAPNVPNATVVEALTETFSVADEAALVQAAYELESAAAATHTALLAELKSTRGAALVASIQPVEARQAVVLGRAGGMAIPDVVPEVQTTDGALDPADYPIEG